MVRVSRKPSDLNKIALIEAWSRLLRDRSAASGSPGPDD
jgi:hypothetical protein